MLEYCRFKNRFYFARKASCLSLGHTQASEDILPPWPTSDRGPHGEVALDAPGIRWAGLEGAELHCWGPHGAESRRGRCAGNSPGESVFRVPNPNRGSLGVVGDWFEEPGEGFPLPPAAMTPWELGKPPLIQDFPFIRSNYEISCVQSYSSSSTLENLELQVLKIECSPLGQTWSAGWVKSEWSLIIIKIDPVYYLVYYFPGCWRKLAGLWTVGLTFICLPLAGYK